MTDQQMIDVLKDSLMEIANKGAYEMDYMIGGEHGHGVSLGLVKAGKYAAMILQIAGFIENHSVLDANVTLNVIEPHHKQR